MKPHYRLVRTAIGYYVSVSPTLGWSDRHDFKMALITDSFGDAVRLLSALADQEPLDLKEVN